MSDIPGEIYDRLWTYPVLDSRGNLRALVSRSGVGSGASALHGGTEDGPIVLEGGDRYLHGLTDLIDLASILPQGKVLQAGRI